MNNSCNTNDNCNTQSVKSTGNGFVIIIVLYILLAIIIGSCLY